ncbi:MAG TPA: hypothetical protein VH701_04620 [Vicinamibacterales bacterium]|jgi:hypothetical protein
MRTLVKLVIVGLILHATWRTGSAYMGYYRFRDELQQLAQFGAGRSEPELANRALEIASELSLPVLPENVSVRRDDNHTFIDAVYKAQIEILPTRRYPWEFKISVDAWSVEVPKASDLVAPK